MNNENTPINEHDIPKQYDPAAAQEKWATYWDEHQLFQSHFGNTPSRTKPFCIVIPPPNVTGALHMGHALNNTLQDITIRMKRMQGFDTVWIPGVDHAGIATQAVVERKLFEEEKKTRHDIGREALVQRIWDWKEKYQDRIIEQLKAMGCSCDWSQTRFTLDERCVKAVRHFFFKLFKENLIYRGKRLVNWDTHLQTAVSDDEVFHETVEGNFWYIEYKIESQSEDCGSVNVVVATTRPETLLGDTAVAVHPDPESALNKAIDELKKRIAAASEKEKADLQAELDSMELRKTDGTLDRLKTLTEMAAKGTHVILPLLDKRIPLIADVWAKPEKGTGCVKITPAHDPNDYEVGRRQNLPMINILNKDGTLNDHAGPYSGLTMKKAREKIVADLDSQGLLIKTEERIIELAHSDRSKTPIEPFLNDQWFVKMDMLSQQAIDTVQSGEVNIYPERYTKGYVDWLSEKRDWPIGRQLWWGHRIPIWYCEEATESELQKAFAGRTDVTWQWSSEGNVWWICSQEEDLAADTVPGRTLIQEEDVLDTWFSSALWPHSTLGWPDATPELQRYYPTGVLITNRDILTLWVARMVLAGKFNTGKKPFDNVFIHPKILDKYGEGMSKSKGNGIDPISVIGKYGADALRFALAYLTTENQDIRLILDFECPHCGALVEQTKKNRTLPKIMCPKCKNEFRTQWAELSADKALPEGPMIGERFEVARHFCNKLWNAARFVMMNLGDDKIDFSEVERFYEPDVSIDNDSGGFSLNPEDAWILSRLNSVIKSVTYHLEHYHFAEAMRELYDFTWNDFCSFYIEMSKARLELGDNDTTRKRDTTQKQAKHLLVYVLHTLLRLLHPVIPFVTEEIFGLLKKSIKTESRLPFVSIAIETFPVEREELISKNTKDRFPDIKKRFAEYQEVLRAIREVRASRNIPPKTDIKFSVRCEETTATFLLRMVDCFYVMARAKAQSFRPDISETKLSATVPLTGMDVFVDLSDLIDIPAEIAKLEKEMAKLDGFIQSKESKLAGDFVTKAPAAVVDKERQSLAEYRNQRHSAMAALEQLRKR